METKINSNLNSEKNKKGVNMSTGEAAASAAGIAGVAGAAAVGIATGSFSEDEKTNGGTNGGGTTGGGTTGAGTTGGDIASNQNEETTQQTTGQDPVDPTDVPFTDTNDSGIVDPVDVATDQIAEVNVDEIVNEILDIEEVNPTDTDVLAEVVDYEDVGIIYTEDGEEIPADLLAMQEDTTTDEGVFSTEIVVDEGDQIALVDGDLEETFPEPTDHTDESFDTMDFSGDFIG